MKKRILALLLFISATISMVISAQTVVNVPSDFPPNEGNLNNAVQAAIDAGTLTNTVFQLEAYGYYVLIGTINVPAGQHLTVVGPEPGNTQETAIPQIVWSASGSVNNQYNFDCFGDITLKNVWLLYANTTGAQVGSCLQIEDDPNDTNGRNGNFEGVIFDYSPCPQNISSGAVSIACTNFIGSFKDCYFKNCVDTHLRYYGRAVSFPYNTTGWHTERISFENCTFANMGYVYMQEGGEYGDDVRFNHCTFLNVMVFPLESGWWNKLAVTNTIFVNCNMFGNNPSQTGTGDVYGGTLRIDSIATFGFEVPFTEEDRRVLFTNSSYFVEQWLSDWMYDNPNSQQLRRERRGDEVPEPMPMLSPNTLVFFDSTDESGNKVFPYLNRADLYDAADPGFILPPTDIEKAKDYLLRKWTDNSDADWAWKPENSTTGLWPLEENLSYTNETLKTAGLGGFPLGDLRWWPTEKAQWEAQAETERAAIENMLMNGLTVDIKDDEGSIPSEYSLSQNYPNPFNPTTNIKYSIPVTGHVSLKVFNTLGQEITTLFEGVQQSGNHEVSFDASRLSSGVYMYTLQSGSLSITKKFVLMK